MAFVPWNKTFCSEMKVKIANFSSFCWSLELISFKPYFGQSSFTFKELEKFAIFFHFTTKSLIQHGTNNANSKGLPVGGALRAPIKNVYRSMSSFKTPLGRPFKMPSSSLDCLPWEKRQIILFRERKKCQIFLVSGLLS